MTRTGKIARLPGNLRDQLNHRLQSGEQGKDIVHWLNSLPEVKKLLKQEFESRPVSEQNLSEWRNGGYQDWLRQQRTKERLEAFLNIAQAGDDLRDDNQSPVDIPQRLSNLLAVELACAIQELLAETTDLRERLKHIHAAVRSLKALRRSDQTAAREYRQESDWYKASRAEAVEAVKAEKAREQEEELSRSTKDVWDIIERATFVETLGGGPDARTTAEFLFNEARRVRGEGPLPPIPVPKDEKAANKDKSDSTDPEEDEENEENEESEESLKPEKSPNPQNGADPFPEIDPADQFL